MIPFDDDNGDGDSDDDVVDKDCDDDILLTALLWGVEEEAITITLRDNEDFAKNIARTMLMMMLMMMMMIMLTMLMTMMVKWDKNILKDCNKFAVGDIKWFSEFTKPDQLD